MTHSALIGFAHTLSPWTLPGLNGCAVSARPAQTRRQMAHHPQLRGSQSPLDQFHRGRRMVMVGSGEAKAGAGPSLAPAFSSLPW